jgi:hypothetical protein
VPQTSQHAPCWTARKIGSAELVNKRSVGQRWARGWHSLRIGSCNRRHHHQPCYSKRHHHGLFRDFSHRNCCNLALWEIQTLCSIHNQNQNSITFFGFNFLELGGGGGGLQEGFWPWPLGVGAAQCRAPPRRRWRLVRTGGCGRWIQTSTRRPRRGSTNRRHGQRRGKYSSKNISQTCGDHKPPCPPHPPHNADAPRVAFPSFWLVRASGGRPWQAPCSCARSAPLARTSSVCKNSVPSVDVSVIFRS